MTEAAAAAVASHAGRVVVVTGASSGIGRATAHALAREGARLLLSSRSAASLADVADECRSAGADVEVVAADVLDEDALQAVIDREAYIANMGPHYHAFFSLYGEEVLPRLRSGG